MNAEVSPCPGCGVPEGSLHAPGCLQKVVDDHLLMERKARAWDELRDHAKHMDLALLLDELWARVHPAQPSSTR